MSAVTIRTQPLAAPSVDERTSQQPNAAAPPPDGGKLIVITAPLTEVIDHAGYFIQMAMASMPTWMEGVLNRKYPKWREVEHNPDGSARYMPAGARLLETSLLREYAAEDIVSCFPDDLPKFVGPRTRVVAVSTHNPLGVTFAAGVYTSNVRLVKDADQLALLARTVCQNKKQSVSRKLQGHRRRLRRLADHEYERI